MNIEFKDGLAFAKQLDHNDPLNRFRDEFWFPLRKDGSPFIYLCGNSLGLQSKSMQSAIVQELEDWKKFGVEGHFNARNPWVAYHEYLTKEMAEVVGAKPSEVVVMNTLTVNLHLMMVSFYRPQGTRNKIIIESDAFPSDRYAVLSQIKFHGLEPEKCLIQLQPRAGEKCLREEDIEATIEEHGDSIALVMMGNTNYYTGQYFDMEKITRWGHEQGSMVGFDCAHGAGNVPLNLHDSGCDFAVWCNYKYLNAGPGSLGGAFVHDRHSKDTTLPRFEGWWGHNQSTRFKMRDAFDPMAGVEAWQLSNPPILSMVAVWNSLKLFKQAGIQNLRNKSIQLTGYLEFLISNLKFDNINIITPRLAEDRGAQLSIQVENSDKKLFELLSEQGVIADWREPDVIRVAPAPMYNSFEDVFNFSQCLETSLRQYENK